MSVKGDTNVSARSEQYFNQIIIVVAHAYVSRSVGGVLSASVPDMLSTVRIVKIRQEVFRRFRGTKILGRRVFDSSLQDNRHAFHGRFRLGL